MKRRTHAILAAVLAAKLLSGRAQADAPDPGSVYPQPTYTADQFIDFIGINASLFEKFVDKGENNFGVKYPLSVYTDLGIRHYRLAMKNSRTRAEAPQLVREAFEQHGIRPTMLLNLEAGTPEELVATLKQYGGSEVIGAVEGPNEVNNKFGRDLNLKYARKTDEAAGSQYMRDYYPALKADPATRDIPVINFTAIFSDYRLARTCDAFDFNNMHSYQGYNVPSSSLLKNVVRANNILPAGSTIKPFMPTECGYNIEEDKNNQIKGNGSPTAQALNLPVLLGEYFRHGISRTYLFAIHNADGYGLLETDQETKRPAYFAMSSLTSALKDANWNPQTKRWEGGQFSPRALLFTVDGAPTTLKSVTLQKQSGEYTLLVWNELPNWDSAAKKELVNPPASVTIKFTTPLQSKATLIRQDATGAFAATEERGIDNGTLKLDVPSSVLMVRVTPQDVSPGSAIAAPQQLDGEATENTASLRWTPAPEAAGYFVYRNGWCVASVPANQQSFEDRSPWLRPGLGYTYEVQAYDRTGSMSTRTAKVIQTAAKLPDLVVTRFGPEKDPTPGEAVRFKVKVKNIGDGATPHDVPISAAIRLNGQVLCWFSDDSILQPGEEREYLADGGPKGKAGWIAEAGSHTLVCVMDDINRIPGEKSKNNNLRDRALIVGASTAGTLIGSSEAAPRKIDLAAEGTEDWVHWGYEGPTGVNRKSGADKISAVTPIARAKFGSTGGSGIRSVWTGGQPTASHDGTNSALWTNGVDNGYTFNAPADKDERVLKVYVSGINGCAASLTAALSDGSAPDYISTTWTGNSGRGSSSPVPGEFAAVYTVRYRAAADNQTLKIDLKLAADASKSQGQLRLSAATLSRASVE